MGDLKTFRALPTHTIDQIDPFLFLNHHGPQVYKHDNRGLPFGPHPHRGMETVTFIIEGDIMHKDSGGHESVIEAGGVQWMTAGSGLIHAEVSSAKFKKHGGPLEILQLWVNLPARLKMTKPAYTGLQKHQIPAIPLADGKAIVNLISGSLTDVQGPIHSMTNVFMSTVSLQKGAQVQLTAPQEHNVFFYVIRGQLTVNGEAVSALNLVEFNNDSKLIELGASNDSLIIFGHAKPFEEPVVAQGPFVMNTEEEIYQAYEDYQAGKFGTWT
jgi:quercetin 2,3-dioxygenase